MTADREIHFTCSEQDVLDAQRTFFKSTIFSKRVLRRYLISLSVMVWVGVVVFLVIKLTDTEEQTILLRLGSRDLWIEIFWLVVLVIPVWLALMAIFTAMSWLGLPRVVRRIYGKQKTLHADCTVSWNEEAMGVVTPKATQHMLWTDFIRWSESKTSIILFQSDHLFNFIPKSALSAENLTDFRQKLMVAKVPQAGVKRE